MEFLTTMGLEVHCELSTKTNIAALLQSTQEKDIQDVKLLYLLLEYLNKQRTYFVGIYF